MKKLSAFLIVFLLALAGATYLYYTHWRSEYQAGEAMPYILQSAALVYEVADFDRQWENFQQTPIAQELSPLPAFAAIQKAISFFKDLLEGPQGLAGVPLTLSVHELGEEQLDYIFYFNTHHTATQTLLGAIMPKISPEKAYSKAGRKYAGYKIITLSKQGATKHLSYIKHGQYIIASFSSLLIEDVVRALASKRQGSFLGLKKSATTQGSLYVNFSQLPQLLRTFVQHSQADALSTSLATFAQTSQLNVKLTQHHLLLSGFAQAQEPSVQYLTNVLTGQSAGSMLLAPYLPQNTAVLQHVTFSDAEQLLAALQQYRAQANAPEEAATDLLTATLYLLLQGEVGHCTLAASQHQKASQLVLMKVVDPHAFTEALKGASLLTALSSQRPELPASCYKIKTDYFQHWLTGRLFPAFEANYLTQVADYIVLANSQLALQTWYTQCQQGKTWANTPTKNAWLASNLDQAQFSLLVDLQKAWPQIMRSLKPAWQQVCEPHADALQSFSQGSVQLLHEPNAGAYMSILLKHKAEDSSQASPVQQAMTIQEEAPLKTLPISAFFQAEAPIIHAPWLVKSHRSKRYYVLLQDALHQLYLLDPDGKLLWKKTLEGPITTDVFEIDFYKNNKTQYLFATDSQLYLIDYYGRRVSRYPHPLPQPVRLQVVDYNHDKHYRFLMATAQGDIYLKDKQYRPLIAWNPKALEYAFAGTPFHIRVQGKDYLLALQTNGALHALNRKGQSYPGFPVDLKAPVHNSLLVRKGKTAADTSLVVLTDTGQHICLNLAGQVQETRQLDHAEGTAHLIVCPNHVLGNRYAIVRKDTDKIAVMDEALNLLFELPYQAQRLLVQYYDFGDGLQFYMLTNPDEQRTSLYNYTGKQLQATPWQGGHEVRLIFSKEKHQLEVYSCAATQFMRYLVPLEEVANP